MFIRYRRDSKGKPVAQSLIYSAKEHGIDRAMIDRDAVRIIERLKQAGYEAYIVGGAVRDLIQNRIPKDFDLVTDALPTAIRKLFRNARIIGKRFRLVHIIAGDTIYEVSTFRSNRNGSVGNEFGTMEEDAQRRDFTFNALYYDPIEQLLVDFVGGFKDLKAGKIKPIIPMDRIFREDPVRIIRGVKYGVIAGFSMPFLLRRAIRRDARLLAEVSPSRMTEEFFKILGSGKARTLLNSLSEFRLLQYFVPSVWERMRSDLDYSTRLFTDLEALDSLHIEVSDPEIEAPEELVPGQGRQRLSILLSYFLKSWIVPELGGMEDSSASFRMAMLSARNMLQPLNPPRVELEAAVLMIYKSSELSPLQKPEKSRRRRRGRRKPAAGHAGTMPASTSEDSGSPESGAAASAPDSSPPEHES